MLPRTQRIPTQLFKEIVLKGGAFHAPLFVLKVFNGQKISRFGVSVPKKVAKTAVLRNSVRRRVYSAIRNVSNKGVTNPKNAIFIMKVGSEKASLQELIQEISKIFVKSGLLK